MEEEFHNHMRIPWHDYTRKSIGHPITEASLSEKASIIGRTGIMLLSCGTGAWRVRSSMNTLARELGITCTADIGLLSIEYTCIDGGNCYTESLCLFNTGVNTSKLYRMEEFVNKFAENCKKMSGDELHTLLDRIHEIHGFFAHHCHLAGKACKHQNDQRKANAPVHSQHQHKAGNRRDLSAHQIRQLMGKVSLHLGAVFINDFS